VAPHQFELVFPLKTTPLKWHWARVELSDESGKPEWYEHPIFGSRVDVAVLPISFGSGFEAEPITSPVNENENAQLSLESGGDVFVLGFPRNKTGGGALPIWKHGSIASEPAADLDGLPKVLIDTASRQGMSGSPVFARELQVVPVAMEGVQDVGALDYRFQFLGVYSGRIFSERPVIAYLLAGKQEEAEAAYEADLFEAQLGIVWKASVIEEVIKGKKLGKTDFTVHLRSTLKNSNIATLASV